jgi:hypothetical protein
MRWRRNPHEECEQLAIDCAAAMARLNRLLDAEQLRRIDAEEDAARLVAELVQAHADRDAARATAQRYADELAAAEARS